ncbi:MAG TPA: hypothetical protein VIW29_06850 [Polyangiaceae bacterium]
MRSVRASIICALSALTLELLGCSKGGELPERQPDLGAPVVSDPDELRLPFLVEDYFVPNGCFGDANCASHVLTIDGRGCSEGRVSAQGVCRRYHYQPLAAEAEGFQGYLGILFQAPHPTEVEIGRVPGLPVAPGARRVVFWARVEGDPILVDFRSGGANEWEGVTDPSLPYKDDFGVPMPVTLDNEFQQIEIDLSGVTYDTVVSPFGWAIASEGSIEPVEMDIEDVRWE